MERVANMPALPIVENSYFVVFHMYWRQFSLQCSVVVQFLLYTLRVYPSMIYIGLK